MLGAVQQLLGQLEQQGGLTCPRRAEYEQPAAGLLEHLADRGASGDGLRWPAGAVAGPAGQGEDLGTGVYVERQSGRFGQRWLKHPLDPFVLDPLQHCCALLGIRRLDSGGLLVTPLLQRHPKRDDCHDHGDHRRDCGDRLRDGLGPGRPVALPGRVRHADLHHAHRDQGGDQGGEQRGPGDGEQPAQADGAVLAGMLLSRGRGHRANRPTRMARVSSPASRPGLRQSAVMADAGSLTGWT